jgi:hypothetical protein
VGKLRRVWEALTSKELAPFIDEAPPEEAIGVRDLLRFMEKQNEQNAQMMTAAMASSVAATEMIKGYFELLKPREVKSTTLAEREAMAEASSLVRESEWETIADFKHISGTEVPPDPSEW